MFNLAQRQLRIFLREVGGEALSLQTDPHAKNLSEKRKLFLVQWLQQLGASLLVVSVRRTTALSCLFSCLHFALFQHFCETTKWDSAASTHLFAV